MARTIAPAEQEGREKDDARFWQDYTDYFSRPSFFDAPNWSSGYYVDMSPVYVNATSGAGTTTVTFL